MWAKVMIPAASAETSVMAGRRRPIDMGYTAYAWQAIHSPNAERARRWPWHKVAGTAMLIRDMNAFHQSRCRRCPQPCWPHRRTRLMEWHRRRWFGIRHRLQQATPQWQPQCRLAERRQVLQHDRESQPTHHLSPSPTALADACYAQPRCGRRGRAVNMAEMVGRPGLTSQKGTARCWSRS